MATRLQVTLGGFGGWWDEKIVQIERGAIAAVADRESALEWIRGDWEKKSCGGNTEGGEKESYEAMLHKRDEITKSLLAGVRSVKIGQNRLATNKPILN